MKPLLLSQRKAIAFAKPLDKCGIFAEMGLGKTRAALEIIKTRKPTRTLIIAPSRVIATTWQDEPLLWDCPVPVACTGTPKQRLSILYQDPSIMVLSSTLVVWLCNVFKEMKIHWPYDLLIVDESHQFKAYGTERFKALKPFVPEFKQVLLLTGTPQEKNEADLYTQTYLLDAGKALGKNITRFRMTYMHPKPYVRGQWELNDGAAEAIKQKIKPLFLTLKAEDYVDLPDRVYNKIRVLLPEDVHELYQDVKKKLFADLGTAQGIVKPTNQAVAASKLAQIAAGFVITSKDERVPGKPVEAKVLHETKLDALSSIVDASASPVLVGYWHKAALDMLQKRFPKATTFGDDMSVVAQWNRQEIPLLFVHPQRGATGLNLQAGGHTIVWYELPASATLRAQFEARLHRTGQQAPVVIHLLLADVDIDHARLEQSEGKRDALDRLFKSFK